MVFEHSYFTHFPRIQTDLIGNGSHDVSLLGSVVFSDLKAIALQMIVAEGLAFPALAAARAEIVQLKAEIAALKAAAAATAAAAPGPALVPPPCRR